MKVARTIAVGLIGIDPDYTQPGVTQPDRDALLRVDAYHRVAVQFRWLANGQPVTQTDSDTITVELQRIDSRVGTSSLAVSEPIAPHAIWKEVDLPPGFYHVRVDNAEDATGSTHLEVAWDAY